MRQPSSSSTKDFRDAWHTFHLRHHFALEAINVRHVRHDHIPLIDHHAARE
jgi:hypothetical protein